MRLSMEERRLFIRKTVTVLLASLALVPLTAGKSEVPASLYLGALVVLHIFILGLYLYRTQVRDLDQDWRSLLARVFALAVVVYLLMAVSRFDLAESMRAAVLQALGVAALHTIVLALLMTRVRYDQRAGTVSSSASVPLRDPSTATAE